MPSNGAVQLYKFLKYRIIHMIHTIFFVLFYSKGYDRTRYQVGQNSLNVQVYFSLEICCKLILFVGFLYCKSETKMNTVSTCFLLLCCFSLSITQKPESLSALTSLMQEPGSPEVKKPAVIEKDSKELSHLVSYSIVIDVKSTV